MIYRNPFRCDIAQIGALASDYRKFSEKTRTAHRCSLRVFLIKSIELILFNDKHIDICYQI